MTVIQSQDLKISIPRRRIIRTTVEQKDERCWIITATVENDRPITLARFPNEAAAITADVNMWLSSENLFAFPVYESGEEGEKCEQPI